MPSTPNVTRRTWIGLGLIGIGAIDAIAFRQPLSFLPIAVGVVVLLFRAAAFGGSQTTAFTSTLTSGRSVAQSREWVVTSFVPAMRDGGYQMNLQNELQIGLTRTYRTGVVWFFTVITFPIGLLFFFAFKRTSNITMFLSAAGTGSQILVSGEAPQSLVAQIEAIAR